MTSIVQRRSFFTIPAIFLTTTVFVALAGCQTVAPTHSNNSTVMQTQTLLTPAVQTVVGDYATSDYDKRAQGYDWVGVMVRPFGDAEIDIKVRARADIKQPSCNYDGKATLMGQDDAHGVIFQTIANDSATFFQFKDGILTIDSPNKYALNYFCSGGSTLAGDYQKLPGNLKLS